MIQACCSFSIILYLHLFNCFLWGKSIVNNVAYLWSFFSLFVFMWILMSKICRWSPCHILLRIYSKHRMRGNLFRTIFLIDLSNFERRLYFFANFCRINANNWAFLQFILWWLLLRVSMQLKSKFLSIRKIRLNLFSRLHSSIKN